MSQATDSKTTFALSARARRAADQPISYLLAEALANPRLISLAAGLVDYESLPGDSVSTLLQSILREPESARAALQYGTTKGYAPLRALLYDHLAELDAAPPDDFPGSAEDIVICTGSQQLLHILTDLLVDPGDIVIAAWPSYFVYTGALSAFGARVRTVDLDEHGMVPQKLDTLLAELVDAGQLPNVKIIYTCTYHQNPTGLTLSAERRPAILDIARRYSDLSGWRILVIEDAAYRELTFGGQAPPSIKRHDTENQYVALLQTFSKPFAPGLKTGYGLLPGDLVEPVALQKGGRDFGSANLCQHLLHEALRRGIFKQHVQKLRRTYAAKRDAMLDALETHLGPIMPHEIHWTRPTGGLYVWLTLPETIDTGRTGPLFSAAIEQGVLFLPGQYCYPQDDRRTPPRNTMRLSFGVPTIDQIHTGIERLAEAIRRVANRTGGPGS